MMFRLLLVVLLFTVAALGQLTDDQLARVEKLENTLLAPCCYNEPVAQHRSEVSLRMKAEIRRMVAEGESDREILDHYKAEYGLRVLVEPEGGRRVWIHMVPVVAIVLGLLVAVLVIRRWLKPLPAESAPQ